LLDPFEEDAHVYRPDQPPERVASFDETLTGEDVLPGFELPLDLLH
jgi:Uma2 family endonuclease